MNDKNGETKAQVRERGMWNTRGVPFTIHWCIQSSKWNTRCLIELIPVIGWKVLGTSGCHERHACVINTDVRGGKRTLLDHSLTMFDQRKLMSTFCRFVDQSMHVSKVYPTTLIGSNLHQVKKFFFQTFSLSWWWRERLTCKQTGTRVNNWICARQREICIVVGWRNSIFDPRLTCHSWQSSSAAERRLETKFHPNSDWWTHSHTRSGSGSSNSSAPNPSNVSRQGSTRYWRPIPLWFNSSSRRRRWSLSILRIATLIYIWSVGVKQQQKRRRRFPLSRLSPRSTFQQPLRRGNLILNFHSNLPFSLFFLLL